MIRLWVGISTCKFTLEATTLEQKQINKGTSQVVLIVSAFNFLNLQWPHYLKDSSVKVLAWMCVFNQIQSVNVADNILFSILHT